MDPAPAKATVKERVMPTSVSRPVAQPQRFGTLWWLPSGGISNGIGDDAWAPILDVSADLVTPLLTALREAGVPGYAAAVARRNAPASHVAAQPRCRLWVGSSAHGRAEETLMKALARLIGGSGRMPSLAGLAVRWPYGSAVAGQQPERTDG
jgi:hypothetical protein